MKPKVIKAIKKTNYWNRKQKKITKLIKPNVIKLLKQITKTDARRTGLSE